MNPTKHCLLAKDLTWISCPVNPHWPSLKPHSFLPTSHLPATPKCMQVPSSPCTSPPTILAHGLLPMGLRVYWGEWCGQTSWLYISWDTQRPTPQRGCLPDTVNHEPELQKDTPAPTQSRTPSPTQSHMRAPPQPESNKPTGGALVLWQERTPQCLPPPTPSLSSPTGVGGPAWAGQFPCDKRSRCKPFKRDKGSDSEALFSNNISDDTALLSLKQNLRGCFSLWCLSTSCSSCFLVTSGFYICCD